MHKYEGDIKVFSFLKKDRKIILKDDLTQEIAISHEKVNMKKNYIKEILANKKLPIVLLDPLWHSIREQIVSQFIEKNEEKLQELLKEQGKLTNDQKEYGIIKQKFLKEIRTLSASLQGEEDIERIEQLGKLHETTLGANQKLQIIEERLGDIEAEIEAVNREIIQEIVGVGYQYISISKESCERLDKEINVLRDQLLLKANEKKKHEQIIKGIYNYMHHVVGQNQIEIIDKELWDKQK